MDNETRQKVVGYLTPKEPTYSDEESELLETIRAAFEKLPLRKRAGVLAELSARLYRSADW